MIKQNTTYQKTFKTIFNETIHAGLDTLQRILTGYELPRGSLWPPTVIFTQPKNKTTYGYDHFRYQAHKGTGLYEQYTLDGKHYEMPWFSVPTGQPAVVQANISSPDTTFNADTIRFRSSLGMNIIPESSPQDSVLYLSIQGRTHEQEQVIEAFIPYVDSTGTQQEKAIGQCKVITYNSTAHNLVVVPLNNATAPTGAVLEDRLNDIYKTSATEWVVSIDDPLDIPRTEWDTDDDGALDYEAFGRKYCKEMRSIYNYYEDKHSIDKNNYYLFLVPEPLKDDYVAYMPLKGQFAFISTGEVTQDELSHTLAHELGHGSFRLYHTFSDKNDYPAARGTTDNLMDYNNGSQLHKYQWDYIKDPQNMMFAWAQGEEEGAMIITDFEYTSVGYGGSEAVQKHIFEHKDEIVAIVKDFGLALNPDIATEILISYYGDVEILNNQEAYGYLVNLLKYDRLCQITKNREKLLQAIGDETNEQRILDIIRENIDTETDLAIDLSAETFELVAHLREIYNISKDIPIDELKRLLPTYLNSTGKKELLLTLSNTKFKELLRGSGITKNSDIQELVNLKNARSSSYYTDSRIIRLTEGLGENQITKLLDNTSDLGIIDVAKKENNLTSSIFDNSVKLQNISNVLEITGYAVDLAIVFKNIANGQDLEPADLLFMIPGAPELVKSIVNNMSIESFLWENELPWEDIKKWNISDYHNNKTKQEEYGIPGHLYLQYTQNRGKANPNIYPTSFIFLTSSLANEVFGFNPSYVNYNNESGFNGENFIPQAQSDKITW